MRRIGRTNFHGVRGRSECTLQIIFGLLTEIRLGGLWLDNFRYGQASYRLLQSLRTFLGSIQRQRRGCALRGCIRYDRFDWGESAGVRDKQDSTNLVKARPNCERS